MLNSSLTAATLSGWLHDAGTMSVGGVAEIHVEPAIETATSTLVFVTATYTPDAPLGLPRQLVVKAPRMWPGQNFDDISEARFYRRLALALGSPPLVRCLAAIEAGANAGTLVLEDLRATHDHPPWPLPPTRSQCDLAVEALSRLHAQWWESPALGATIGEPHTNDSLSSMVYGVAAQLPAFIDAYGDMLPAETRRTYERVFASSLRPWLRLTDPNGLTLIHGDAHSWNVLFPRSGDGPAYLIDWQLWHVDLGARDLAFLIALHWYPSRRRELESELLRYYHDGMVERGLRNYSFDELWLDYRLCVVRNLTIPIIFWSRGMKPEGWWHRLECAVAAYHDLDCADLL